MTRKWLVRRTNPEFIGYISRQARVHPVTAQILVNRGLNSPGLIRDFFNPGLSSLTDPFDLPGMEEAVGRIRKAALAGERVLVHGDYDADGTTATAVMLGVLERIGVACDYFIPNRFDHGYGFHAEAIGLAESTGASLIITVDCGINSFDEVSDAASRGIDVIITDHHEPTPAAEGGYITPPAVAVVNPRLSGDNALPLSGAGVALMIAIALMGVEGAEEFFDLVTVGTVADVVPLIGDNRVIITRGLEMINSDTRPAFAALREVAAASSRDMTAGLLSFTLIPRINASGRMSDASAVIRLLRSTSVDEAMPLAQELDASNRQRQKAEEDVLKEALAMLEGREVGPCIVLAAEGWHEGVVGIVAARIADMFNRPAFVLSVRDGVARGSARSIPAFDLCDGLSRCSGHLIRYGGHRQAAGLALRAEHLDRFSAAITSVIESMVPEEDFESPLVIDSEVTLRDLSFSLVRELERLQPFGPGNEEPLLAARGVEAVSPRIVKNNHLKLRLKHGSSTLDAIGFNMGNEQEKTERAGRIDAAFVPSINEWNGTRSVQLILKALRPSL